MLNVVHVCNKSYLLDNSLVLLMLAAADEGWGNGRYFVKQMSGSLFFSKPDITIPGCSRSARIIRVGHNRYGINLTWLLTE